MTVRNDLSNAQKAVQAAHAAIEATHHYLDAKAHPNLVITVVKGESRLAKLAIELNRAGLDFQAFYEPDIGNEMTALATRPLVGDERKFFSKFQLLT